MMHRRTFLQQVGLLTAVAASQSNAVAAFVASALGGTSSVAGQPTYARFAPARGDTFTLNGAQPVVLGAVEEFQRGPQVENFSLRFEGSADAALTDGIHRFEHAQLGSFDLFVVATVRPGGRCVYEAVFNRLT